MNVRALAARRGAEADPAPPAPPGMEGFYALEIPAVWNYFKKESFSFWMICCYLFVEYVRPQSIMPSLDFLPWAKLFVVLAAVGWLADPNKKWVSSPFNKWLIIFFVAILASSFNAYYPDWSWDNLANYWTWMVIYFLIINIVNTKQRFFIFILIFLVASYKISMSLAFTWASRGFSFASWGLAGPPGFFQNSGELAIQMAVYWPIALVMAQGLKPYTVRWKYRLFMGMPITAGMVILGASSRGGQLALIVQMAFRYWRTVFKPRSLIGIALICSIGWMLLPPEQKLRFTEAGDDVTSQQRLLYWEHGIDMFQEHPVLGVGYFNFIPYYTRHYGHDLLVSEPELAHNIFIQIGADLGLAGLIPYCSMIIAAFIAGRKIGRAHKVHERTWWNDLGPALNVSLLGFIVAGQFVSVAFYPFMWIHLALLTCVYRVVVKDTARDVLEERRATT